jgi:serine phosphatase RsbU (regulator of sigma subunit)
MERAQSRLGLLLDLTSGLAERMGLQAIASFVLGVGLDAIEANRGTLCLVTDDGLSLDVVAHAGYDSEMMDSWRRFALDAPYPASDVVRTQTPIYLHSPAERAARYPIFADSGGDGASAMLPLAIRDVTLGAIVWGFDGEREFDEIDRSILVALATQCAIAIDRARLYELALRRQANLSLLADASSILAGAGDDLDGALQKMVNRVVPLVADISSFHLLESPNESRVAARAYVESDRLIATQRVSEYGADLTDTHGLGSVLRTGREASWDDGERFIEQIARNEEHREALSAMNLGGGIIVPMLAHGRVLGACVFANHRQRLMTEEDRQLARTLGERAAVLLDNARLMRQRRDVSHELQAALLPSSLPSIPGFELAARYQPAGEGLEVGGDFYDVLPLEPGRCLLVVGDVTGHGAKAAAATSLVRHTIRSGAVIGLTPARILDHANSAMLVGDALPSGTYCTIALAMLSAPAEGSTDANQVARAVISSGGHPPPLLRRADGTVVQVQTHGKLLGYFPTVQANEIIVEMRPGDTLVAYTDGVIERHDESNWFGEPELANLVAANDLDADSLAGLIRDTAVNAFSAPPRDDMAILVLRRQPF